MTKTSFVIELDDSKDLTVLKSILDPFVPANLVILNTQFDLFNYNWQTINPENVNWVQKACRFFFEERDETKINQAFNFIIQQAYLQFLQSIIL